MDKDLIAKLARRRRPGQGAGGVPRRCGAGRRSRRSATRAAIEYPDRSRGGTLAADARGDRAVSELHWLTAAEAARRVRRPPPLAGRTAERAAGAHRAARSEAARLHPAGCRCRDGRRARGRDRDRRGPRARAAARRAGRHQGHHRCRRPADHLPFEDPASTTSPRPMRWWSRSCARPARSSWASCRPTSSPSAARASTCRSRRRATRGTPTIIRAARRPAPAPACAPGCSRWRSAPTPADRCAIRPSACGIVGLKPTYGLVSRRGVFPLSFTLDHVGPMTRTVADNALLLDAIAGHDPADPGSAADRRAVLRPHAGSRRARPARRLRAALPRDSTSRRIPR